MARLNEPPAPVATQQSAETLDVVKRRFLRQNRELAKINSQHSVRIRTLENDCAYLRTENLTLREQILQLQNALESQSHGPSFETIDAVKSKLEAKMQELGGLVAELGQLKKVDKRRRRTQLVTTRKAPEERQWRSGLGLQEVENHMLPVIMEDKHFSRRTMEAYEIRQCLEDNDSQSPDIGPPPIARFDNEEPIMFDPRSTSSETGEEDAEDTEPALLANLETRRKRRESGPKINIRRMSVFEASPEETEASVGKLVRASAKRKFAVQEDSEKDIVKADAFRFSRRNASNEPHEDGDVTRSLSPKRLVLGSKPINTDPVISPKKQRAATQDKPGSLKSSKARGKPRLNITREFNPPEPPPVSIPEPEPEIEPVMEIDVDALPPKTPAIGAIFSPPTTQPSTARPESKDTPPPGDLSLADQTGMTGRPGRRARPQVSYKEPSLATKMRRPDAKLADAIVEKRASIGPQTIISASGKPVIKHELLDDQSWKPSTEKEMGSPLREKLDRWEISNDMKSSGTEPAEPRVPKSSKELLNSLEDEMVDRQAVTSTANKAQTKDSRATLETVILTKSTNKKAIAVKEELTDKNDLAVFDFTESSPLEPAIPARPRISDLAKVSRNARRHSAVPTSALTGERTSERGDDVLSALHKRSASGTLKSARSSSLVKSGAVGKGEEKREKLGGQLPASASASDLKASTDVAGVADSGARPSLTSSLRAERAASRRKSMML